MKNVNMITMRAAYDHLAKSGDKYIKLGDIQEMCVPPIERRQKWSFKGNWKNAIQPIYSAF